MSDRTLGLLVASVLGMAAASLHSASVETTERP